MTINTINFFCFQAHQNLMHFLFVYNGRNKRKEFILKGFLLWCLLLILCWPLAILALIIYPFVWLLSLPFRLIGITVSGLFEALTAIIRLPARVLNKIAA